MVVAVAIVRVMEVTIHEIVDVVAVRDGRMPAVGTMDMPGIVAVARVVWRTLCRVGAVHVQDMLIHMVAVRMVEVPIVEVVDVVIVRDGSMPTVGPVDVRVIRVNLARHGDLQETLYHESPACTNCFTDTCAVWMLMQLWCNRVRGSRRGAVLAGHEGGHSPLRPLGRETGAHP